MFLTGEIIHNPHVNDRLRAQGIRILTDPGEDRSTLGPDDVVILPAFGVSIGELAALDRAGLHAGRHDLRLGAERLEERPALRAGRLHVGHPRQGAPRGDARHGLAGDAVSERPLPGRPRRGGGGDRAATSSATAATRAAFIARFGDAVVAGLRPRRAPRPRSAAPTRRRC